MWPLAIALPTSKSKKTDSMRPRKKTNFQQIFACAIIVLLMAWPVSTTRGLKPDSTAPLQLGKRNPISWLRSLILAARRRSLPKKVVFLSARPSKNETKNDKRPSVLLIFFPGTFKSPHDYVELCKSIQQHASAEGIDAHVGIAKFFRNVPFLLGVKEFTDVADAIRTRAASEIATYDATYILGHSIGGIAALIEAVSYKYDGLVLLSTTCNSAGSLKHFYYRRSLASYPKPVLTIVGTRDGFLPYLALVDELEDMQREIDRRKTSSEGEAGEFDMERAALLEKPIVALEEVNHMHLANGVVSNQTRKTGRSDLSSNLSIEDAQDLAGRTVSDFLAAQMKTTGGGQSGLLQAVRRTRSILVPYRDISAPSSVGHFLESIQTKMLNLHVPSNAADAIQVSSHWHETREDFIYSEPIYSTTESVVVIEILPQETLRFSETIQLLSPTYAMKAMGPPLSLSELNAQTFQNVLESHYVTAEQRDRYEREGQKLGFLPDLILVRNSLEWVDAPLEVTIGNETGIDNKTIAFIQSPMFMTSLDMFSSKFSGMWYGKPLTPPQAYEWIVYYAFKDIG